MTLKRPKDKGTAGETELKRLLNETYGFAFERAAPTANYDLVQGSPHDDPVRVLAIRPDRGSWLVLMDLDAFDRGFKFHDRIELEVKRFARSSVHTIYEGKFGGSA